MEIAEGYTCPLSLEVLPGILIVSPHHPHHSLSSAPNREHKTALSELSKQSSEPPWIDPGI